MASSQRKLDYSVRKITRNQARKLGGLTKELKVSLVACDSPPKPAAGTAKRPHGTRPRRNLNILPPTESLMGVLTATAAEYKHVTVGHLGPAIHETPRTRGSSKSGILSSRKTSYPQACSVGVTPRVKPINKRVSFNPSLRCVRTDHEEANGQENNPSPCKQHSTLPSPSENTEQSSPQKHLVSSLDESSKENVPSPRKRPLSSSWSGQDENGGQSSPKKRSTQSSGPSMQEINEQTPQSLKRRDLIESKSPRAMMSPIGLQRQEGKHYQDTKKAFHTAIPDSLLCREKQSAQIEKFLQRHLVKKTAGSLYVSGAPGTGKTAVLTHALKRAKEKTSCRCVFVNCMTVRNSQAIYNKVVSELKGTSYNRSTSEAAKCLENILTSPGPMVLLVLDEVDQLDSKNQEVLYKMFEWPMLTGSRVVLVGIANALDLTDRVLPRLQARQKYKPELLNFPPYSKDQIVTILTSRLSQVSTESGVVLEPSAVQFCARKVSAVAGDIRKALDVCRRAVEMVEADIRSQQILKVHTASNSPCKQPPTLKKISIPHINSVLQEVYGSRVAASSNQRQTIPLHQKVAVCTLLSMLKLGRVKEVTLGKFHEAYVRIGRKRRILDSADQAEFLSLCSLIETRGIVSLKKAKDTRSMKVSLRLDENEVEHALQDRLLMSSILEDGLLK